MKLVNNSLWCFQNDHFLLVSTGELCRDIGDFAFFPVTKVRRNRRNDLEVFLGKGVLKICSKFTGEHPCRSASEFATLLKSHLVSFSGGLKDETLNPPSCHFIIVLVFCTVTPCNPFLVMRYKLTT